MMTTTYTAPASRVLTVVHITDPDVPAGEEPEPCDGATKCGLPMTVAELWVPVDKRESDSVCSQCEGRSDEQGSMW